MVNLLTAAEYKDNSRIKSVRIKLNRFDSVPKSNLKVNLKLNLNRGLGNYQALKNLSVR